MTLSTGDVELARTRWRRARKRQLLLDPDADDFGTGGLARNAPDVRTRFLILPFDPEAQMVAPFDKDFWTWWMQNRDNPFEGGNPTNWGPQHTPTASSAVRFDQTERGQWRWDNYLALHRSAALEFGLGSIGSTSYREQENEGLERRVFFLVSTIGRIWAALTLYGEVIAKYGPDPPFEVVLALKDTEGTYLGNVAAGWLEVEEWRGGRQIPTCPEPNLLFTREVEGWPNTEGIRDLTFWFGSVLDEAWGETGRRYLANSGQHDAGQFDVSRYR